MTASSRVMVLCCNISTQERPRARIQYTYPPSPTSSASGRDSPSQYWQPTSKPSISQRIANLKREMDAIEAELVAKAELQDEDDDQHNAADLIRSLADVKARLDKAATRSRKETTRGKLVNAVLLSPGDHLGKTREDSTDTATKADEQDPDHDDDTHGKKVDMLKFTADIDRRLGTLEKIIGSSTTALDEVGIVI